MVQTEPDTHAEPWANPGADTRVNAQADTRVSAGPHAAASVAAQTAAPTGARTPTDGAKPSVIVIGGGLIGATITYNLARAGHAVTLIERAQAASAATSKSFAWINAGSTDNPDYVRLRAASLAAYRDLALTLGVDDLLRTGGSLLFDPDPGVLSAKQATLTGLGCACALLDQAQVRALEPHVANLGAPSRPSSQPASASAAEPAALHCPDDAAIDPVALARLLITAATQEGARCLLGCDATLRRDGDRVTGVATAFGVMRADEIVVAAGTAAADLLASVDVRLPMDNRRGLVVHTHPVAPLVERVILAPRVHFRQERDGRFIAGETFSGVREGTSADALDPLAVADDVLAALRHHLPQGLELGLAQIVSGVRPMPVDGYPAVGRARGVDGLYIASMHSGITLAPIIGQLVAGELGGGEPDPLLAPFRPTRFN